MKFTESIKKDACLRWISVFPLCTLPMYAFILDKLWNKWNVSGVIMRGTSTKTSMWTNFSHNFLSILIKQCFHIFDLNCEFALYWSLLQSVAFKLSFLEWDRISSLIAALPRIFMVSHCGHQVCGRRYDVCSVIFWYLLIRAESRWPKSWLCGKSGFNIGKLRSRNFTALVILLSTTDNKQNFLSFYFS